MNSHRFGGVFRHGPSLPASLSLSFVCAGVLLLAAPVAASDSFSLTLKDHAFVEDMLEVPADTAITLEVVNGDRSAEEFESNDLHVEKIVPPGKSITVRLGPLAAGTYSFFGDFHQATAHGILIAGDAK
jgi:hypothetical protein